MVSIFSSGEATCSVTENIITCSGDGTLTNENVRSAGVYTQYVTGIVEQGITALSNNCFYFCTSLASVWLPEGLVTISLGAFTGTSIRTVTIPKSVQEFVSGFNYCLQLTHIYFLSQSYYKEQDGMIFDLSGNLVFVGAGRCAGETLVLPDATKLLSDCCRWSRADTIIVSDTTTEIESSFYGSSWKTLKLGKNVKTIAYDAFDSAEITNLDVNGNTNFYYTDGCFGALDQTSGKRTSIIWISQSVSTITIPTTVTGIAIGTLQRCKSLTQVKVESGHTKYQVACDNQILVTKYNNQFTVAQICVGGATSITIPSSITRIAVCFRLCPLLQSVILHSGVSYISESAFRSCPNLTTIDFKGCTLSDGQLGRHLFWYSNLHTIVSWPSTSTIIICEEAFVSCGFTNLSLPENIVEIGIRAFDNNQKLETLVIPSSVISILSQAFSYCYNLRSVTFASGSKLTTLSDLVFAHCPKLEHITLPSSVTSLSSSCFVLDLSLTSIAFSSSSNLYTSDGVAVYLPSGSNAFHTLIICPGGVTELQLPDSTEAIEHHTFYGCYNLSRVVLGEHLKRIENSAFFECNSLTSIRFAEQITYIGPKAFSGCTALHAVFYCSSKDGVEYGEDPFPTEPNMFVFYNYEDASFCGQKVQPILDLECNIGTRCFTPIITKKSQTIGYHLYLGMCAFAYSI